MACLLLSMLQSAANLSRRRRIQESIDAAALRKPTIARDALPVDAGGGRPALPARRQEPARRRFAQRRLSQAQSERADSDAGRRRGGAVGIHGDQSLSRAEISGPAA